LEQRQRRQREGRSELRPASPARPAAALVWALRPPTLQSNEKRHEHAVYVFGRELLTVCRLCFLDRRTNNGRHINF